MLFESEATSLDTFVQIEYSLGHRIDWGSQSCKTNIVTRVMYSNAQSTVGRKYSLRAT